MNICSFFLLQPSNCILSIHIFVIHSDIRRTTIKQKQKKKNDLFQRNVWLTIALAIGSLPVESRELMDINIMATASTVGESSNRMSTFKNKGLNMEDCRKKRQEEGIQLRKSRREEQLSKRRNIVYEDDSKEEVSLDEVISLDTLCKVLYSQDEKEILAAVTTLRKFLSCNESPVPIEEAISCGCLPKLVEFLMVPNNQLQFESSWVITNIASGSSEHTKAVVDAGAVPPLIELLLSPDISVCDQVIWALGNIAGSGTEFRDLVLSYGIMKPLLKMLESDTIPKKNVTWTLSNLCRGKNPLPKSEMVSQCIPWLAKLLYHGDKEVLSNCLWSVAFLADGPNDRIQRIVDGGLCLRLTQFLMQSTDKEIITPALRAVGNILTGDDLQTQMMINSSVLPSLQHLLSSSHQKEVCWAISNITAGNRVQIQEVIDYNIFPILIEILSSGKEYKTRKEAAWAILNATSGGTNEQIRYLASVGCIKPLCDMLTVQDTRMVEIILEGLTNILKVGKNYSVQGVNPFSTQIEEAYGLEKIEFLQAHNSDRIYRLAGRIIDQYFSES